MNDVSMTILDGSEGFFKQQYGTISQLSIVFAVIIATLYGIRENPLNLPLRDGKAIVGGWSFAILIGFSFLFGAVCSGLSGFSGMWVSVRANIRVAQAARTSYNTALQIAFKGGYFGAAINIALAIFGVSTLYVVFFKYLQQAGAHPIDHL